MSLSWYVVRTKPHCEYLAARGLSRDGFQIFLPLVGSPAPRAGREDRPLFPGYLFLRYDVDNQDWPSLKQMPGILGWVVDGKSWPCGLRSGGRLSLDLPTGVFVRRSIKNTCW